MDDSWTFEIDDAMRTRPVIDDDVVYAGADNGLSVIDRDTGDRRRHLPFDHWVRITPRIAGDTLCLFVNDEQSIGHSTGGTVYALDGRRGIEHWAIDRDDRITGLAATADIVCYGCDRQVHAVDLDDGEERWRFDNRSLDADSGDRAIRAIAAHDPTVHVATRGGDVRALDGRSGDVRWRFAIDSRPTTMAATDRSVYVGSHGASPAAGDPVLYALDAETGDSRWRLDLEVGVTEPTLHEQAVFVSTDEYVHAIDRESGERLWRHRTGESATNPVVLGDRVHVGTDAGELTALDLYDGHEKESRQLDTGDLRVEYLGGDDGMVVAPVTQEEPWTTTLYAFESPRGTDTTDTGSPARDDSREDTSDEPTRDACPSCGTGLTGDEKFCPECGHDLRDPECPSCGAGLTGDENFCPECGHDL